jgi:hypothetical protein
MMADDPAFDRSRSTGRRGIVKLGCRNAGGHLRPPVAIVVLGIAMLVGACGGAATTPTPLPATPAPTPSPAPTRNDAEVVGLMRNSIDVRYCGDEPYAAWCASLTRIDGAYNLQVQDDSLAIVTTIADTKKGRKLATSMCGDLAAATSDGAAWPIGIARLAIYAEDGVTLLADCEPPAR